MTSTKYTKILFLCGRFSLVEHVNVGSFIDLFQSRDGS